jgi:predicted kinase
VSVGHGATPLLVLVTGAAGSGKTTLAKAVAAELDVLHLERDDIWDGLRFSSARSGGAVTPQGIPVWFRTIALLMENKVSLVADGTLYDDEDQPNVAELLPLGDVVNIHCQAGCSMERFRARKQRDGVAAAQLAHLMARVEADQGRSVSPLDLGCRRLVLTTEDGYSPAFGEVLRATQSEQAL